MKATIGLLALAFWMACASAAPRRPLPKDKPLQETKTYGPSKVIYVHGP